MGLFTNAKLCENSVIWSNFRRIFPVINNYIQRLLLVYTCNNLLTRGFDGRLLLITSTCHDTSHNIRLGFSFISPCFSCEFCQYEGRESFVLTLTAAAAAIRVSRCWSLRQETRAAVPLSVGHPTLVARAWDLDKEVAGELLAQEVTDTPLSMIAFFSRPVCIVGNVNCRKIQQSFTKAFFSFPGKYTTL